MGGALARYGYWILVGAMSVVIVVLLAFIAVQLALPELERAGLLGAQATPAPSIRPISPTPAPSTGIAMGGAVVPADSDCAGCHEGGTGTIGSTDVPPMGHVLEGWGQCASCHAPARLVDTAAGHTGIHASECTLCHQPGVLPAPLSRPHRENQNQDCLTCHGTKAPLPADMTHRSETVCWLCHRLPTIEPPVPAHETAPGEADCLTCHVAGGDAGRLPKDHVDRPAKLCLSCHEVALGTIAAASPTPRLHTWPAPSATPAPTLPLLPSTSPPAP
jgi:hypothetical protein